MGRLIDADDFIERMENDTNLCAEMEKDGLKALKKYLDIQPTAYDVDKVVQQLEEKVKEYDKRIELRKDNCYFDETEKIKALDERARGMEIAIEIVKGEVN